eukprot:gene13409-28440_t
MLDDISKVRHLYTYAGLIHQIELFYRDPFGSNGGLLRCSRSSLSKIKSSSNSQGPNICLI